MPLKHVMLRTVWLAATAGALLCTVAAGCARPDRWMSADALPENVLGAASSEALQRGYVLEEYDASGARYSGGWFVHFERTKQRPYWGGDNHFCVWVPDCGEARFHGGR